MQTEAHIIPLPALKPSLRIKEYRTKHNLTQEKLAEIVGVRQETIIFLEKGKYNPSLKLAHDVAAVSEPTIDETFIFDDD